jgi:uncharacterized phage-like protein YoqJ
MIVSKLKDDDYIYLTATPRRSMIGLLVNGVAYFIIKGKFRYGLEITLLSKRYKSGKGHVFHIIHLRLHKWNHK